MELSGVPASHSAYLETWLCLLGSSAVPPFVHSLNGLECPSCFALGASRCRNVDIMPCRGHEDHCYEISGELIAGKSSWLYDRNWRSGVKSFWATGPPKPPIAPIVV